LPLTAMEPPVIVRRRGHPRQGKAEMFRRPIHPLKPQRCGGADNMTAASLARKGSRPYSWPKTRSRRIPTPRPIPAMRLMIDNWRWAGVPFYLAHTASGLKQAFHRNRHPLQARAALCPVSARRLWRSWMADLADPAHPAGKKAIRLRFNAKRARPPPWRWKSVGDEFSVQGLFFGRPPAVGL